MITPLSNASLIITEASKYVYQDTLCQRGTKSQHCTLIRLSKRSCCHRYWYCRADSWVRLGTILHILPLQGVVPVRRAIITTGSPSPALLLQHGRWYVRVPPLPLLVLWVNIRCTRDPNGVQVNSWQKICRDTYMFFPFNLLVGHLHCIQIFKMQLHQSVNLKARDFTGWVRRKENIKARERWSSCSSHCHSLQRETPPLPLLTQEMTFA